jgi:hypothetical protein
MTRPRNSGVRDVLDGDEVREILRGTFFTPVPPPPEAGATGVELEGETARGRKRRATDPNGVAKPRPEHYKVICISMYNEDLERLDAVVRELKRRGFTKANRSAVLRVAIEQMDLDRVPKGL